MFAVLACLEYLFKDTLLLIFLAKWQSKHLLTSDLNILLMWLVFAYGRLNLFSGTRKFLIFLMLG